MNAANKLSASASVSPRFRAGFATAEADHRRGMSHDAMRRVVQPSDHSEWAEGYTERSEQLIALDAMWSE